MPTGIISAKLMNWDSYCYKIPRNEINEKNTEECENGVLGKKGIYFLFCKDDENDRDSVYIGESENVIKRLKQHINSYNKGDEHYYWISAVVFISDILNSGERKYLECKLCELTNNIGRYELLTKNYSEQSLRTADKDVLDEFAENVKLLILTLGYKLFEPHIVDSKASIHNYSNNDIWHLDYSEYHAEGIETSDGFVIRRGAKIDGNEAPTLPAHIRKLRLEKKENGDIGNDYITIKDILCTSPSAAAEFVLGLSKNGRDLWKNKEGKTMNQIQVL